MTAQHRSPRFQGKIIIVTGASTGIGRALARDFARAGATVVMIARNQARVERAAAEITDGKVIPLAGDVTNRCQVDSLVQQVISQWGRIDILVNNAGAGLIAPLDLIPIADARALFETNFFGTLNFIQAVVPAMKHQGHGHIVNMASVAGLRGIPNSSIYSASKAAVIALSEALRIELHSAGIAVTIICPSRVQLDETGFFTTAKKYGNVELYKLPSQLTAATVARVTLDATALRQRLVILPGHARWMHLANKFAPRLVDRILLKNLPRPV